MGGLSKTCNWCLKLGVGKYTFVGLSPYTVGSALTLGPLRFEVSC